MNKDKIIIHLCASEFGSDSQPYVDAGYDVRRITKDIGVENYHAPANTYGIIANPPCTKFSRAAHQIKKVDRDFKTGMLLVKECLRIIWEVQENGAPLKFWSLENPDGYLTQFLGYPVFSYQPWQFGELGPLATKRTMLWGYFNKPKPTVVIREVAPRLKSADFKKMMANTLFPEMHRQSRNAEWSTLTSDERSRASQHFAKAFMRANP